MSTSDLLAPFDLTGRIALVSGGTSGIGRACVDQLNAYGATVVATCLEGVDDPDAALASFNGRKDITVEPLDLRSTESMQRCLDNVLGAQGRIDILVNNAAVGSATVNSWARDQETQDSQNKKLINISSVGGGIAAFPGFRLSDGMSKAAVAFLTRQLAAEGV